MKNVETLLIGSIGVLTERCDLRRRAFNIAFDQTGLSWSWDVDTYRSLSWLPTPRARVVSYAESRGMAVPVDEVLDAQKDAFDALVRDQGLKPRRGVRVLLERATQQGIRIGLTSTSSARQTALVQAALADHVDFERFEFIGTDQVVAHRKPAPDIYISAMEQMQANPARTCVIEDSPNGARAALNCGLRTYVHAGHTARNRTLPEGARAISDLTHVFGEPALA